MELQSTTFNTKLANLLDIAKQYELKRELEKLTDLQTDAISNDYIIVVVGEFNHGKSSFVNALLGTSLLPTGIIPTTATINALHYSEQPFIVVHYKDAEPKRLTFSEHALTQFVASEAQVEMVDFIRIGLNVPLLQNNVLLIDTPGLNDVNELRSDITYSFMPRADVVFFMLQMHKPLNRTEIEFLQHGLLKQGIDRIIFVANFVDQVDEEEIDEALKILTMRLRFALGIEDVVVYPISSKEALEAKLTNDEELLELSNIIAVEQKLHAMCASGSRQQEKQHRLSIRLDHLQQQVVHQLEAIHAALTVEDVERTQQLTQMATWKNSEQARAEQMASYIEEQQNIILLMLHKSIDHFFTRLSRNVEEKIELHLHGNMETFFTKELPLFIKYQMKNWIEMYTPQLQILFAKLETEISRALTEAYEASVHITQRKTSFEFDETLQLELEQGMDPTLKSGLIVGGASSVLLLTAPILVPVVAAFGMPFLSKKLQTKELEKKKPALKAETMHQLQILRSNFTFKMGQYVRKSILSVTDETIAMIQEQQQQVFEQILKAETMHQQNVEQLQAELHTLEQQLLKLGGRSHV